MRKENNTQLNILVDVACGLQPESALGEISYAQQSRLNQIRSIINTFSKSVTLAPEEAILNAIKIMPKSAKRQVFTSPTQLTPLGARSTTQEHHLLFNQNGVNLRLLYLPNDHGYQVMGQINPESWLVVTETEAVQTNSDGKFSVQVEQLNHPPLFLLGDGETIEVASAGEIYGSIT